MFYKSWMRMTSKRFSWPNVVTYFVVMMVSMMVMRQNNEDVDDDGKDGDDERALLLAEHNYLFVRGLPLAALHLSRY